jgi:hypothetical protein
MRMARGELVHVCESFAVKGHASEDRVVKAEFEDVRIFTV